MTNTNQRAVQDTRLRQIGRVTAAVTTIAIFNLTGALSGATVSSTTTYDDLRGASLTYTQLRESSLTETKQTTGVGITARSITETLDPTVLYGQPSIDGDALQFNNPAFASVAGTPNDNGVIVPSDVTDGRLSFTVEPDATMFIDLLVIKEFGAVSLTGPSAGNTRARIEAPSFLTVSDVMLDNGQTYKLVDDNGIPESTQLVARFDVTQRDTSNGADLPVPDAGWMSPADTRGPAWQGKATYHIAALLEQQNVNIPAGRTIVGATRLEFDMNNTLTAIAQSGSTAFIDKKGITINPRVSSVPEPTIAWLTLPILLAAGFGLNRNRRR